MMHMRILIVDVLSWTYCGKTILSLSYGLQEDIHFTAFVYHLSVTAFVSRDESGQLTAVPSCHKELCVG